MQANKDGMNYYIKNGLILILSLSLILFTQWVKLLKNPESTPITKMTLIGLLFLGSFAIIGIIIQRLMQKFPVKIIRDFPILGWVSITSLIFCIISPFIVDAINSVDFLSITTPILTYAGISVADRLVDLSKVSWKVAITAIFVFIGTYLGSSLLAQLGFLITGK